MIRRVGAVTATLLCLGMGAAMAAELPRVIAVSGPLSAFARAIAGDKADVVYPVPEGEDPMLWRPSIADIAGIQSADLILLNGAGFAGWTTKASLPRARTIVTTRALEGVFIEANTAVTHSHGAEGAHSHSGAVPQTWLDFAQAAVQADAVAEGLRRALPGAGADIESGLAALTADLMALDARARDVGAGLSGRRIIASGPGLAYFARAYGLDLRELGFVPGEPFDAAGLSAAAADAPDALFVWLAEPTAADVDAVALPQTRFDMGANQPGDFIALMGANLDALEALASN